MSTPCERRALVFGASGFLGRWVVKELLDQGVCTNAAIRSAVSGRALTAWLRDHGTPTEHLQLLLVDLTIDGLGIRTDALPEVREVYNCAGAYVFGMSPEQARCGNVETSRRVVEFSAALGVERLVHVSGYRVGGQDPRSVPWSLGQSARTYARLGAYEASKVESDAVVQATALDLGVPLTIANPSTVIGHSATGESDQMLGLATTILDLVQGRLRAIPGGSQVFVPVVTVDYLARFLVLLPPLEREAYSAYWVLDPRTPCLPDLLRLIGDHHHVKVPSLRVPVTLIKTLPRRLTQADPETVSFLSTDRYPTGPAEDLARAAGLHHTDVAQALCRWSDYLVKTEARTLDHGSFRPLPLGDGGAPG